MKVQKLMIGSLLLCLGVSTQALAQEEKKPPQEPEKQDTIALASERLDMEQREVRNTLDQYIQAVEQQNEQGFADLVAHHSDKMFFGTFGDPMVGWDELKGQVLQHFTQLQNVKIEPGHQDIEVAPSGEFAWSTALWKLTGQENGQDIERLVRTTFILEKQPDDTWKIVHFHNSVSPKESAMEEPGEMEQGQTPPPPSGGN
jgi:ketosteroid isomerase-like protein